MRLTTAKMYFYLYNPSIFYLYKILICDWLANHFGRGYVNMGMVTLLFVGIIL